jgi:hypothetical protein
MARFALEKTFHNTDALLARTTDGRHRKILINWRRHACLEVMGRYEEILAPDMTVPHPIYHLHGSGTTTVLDGMAEVADFYRRMAESGACVMGMTDDRIAVNDWGFAIESTFLHYYPGKVLVAGGVHVDDEDATYLGTYPQAMVWSYTPDGLMIGENVYNGARTITKLAPEDVITPAEAVEILTPVLAATPAD